MNKQRIQKLQTIKAISFNLHHIFECVFNSTFPPVFPYVKPEPPVSLKKRRIKKKKSPSMHIPNQNTKWQKWDFQTYRIYKMQTCLANTNPINVSLSLVSLQLQFREKCEKGRLFWNSDKNLQKIFSYVKMCKV